MAPIQTVENPQTPGPAVFVDEPVRPVYYKLAATNGILIGLFVSLGVWGVQIYALRDLPITPKYGSILLAAALVIGLCGFTGWLTARIARTAVTLLL